MAESTGNNDTTRGVVAEYDTPDALLSACNRVREAGYTKTDAFTPFPIHGIDEAIGIKPTILPWIVLGAGISGCLLGMGMEYWMNAVSYPYIISGKPYFSMPAFIPVSFELTILFASFAAFFGQWILNGLPKFSNPLFTSPKFDAATDDKFFLYIDSRDARFDPAGAKQLLGDTEPLSVEDVVEDDSPTSLPRPIILAVIIMAVASLFPLLIIANMRVAKSGTPRFHIFWDMDFMPSKGPQEATTLFSDGRTMRPNVPGTVARGDLELDINFRTGIRMEELAQTDPERATRLVYFVDRLQDGQADADEEADEKEATPEAAGANEDESTKKDESDEQAVAAEKQEKQPAKPEETPADEKAEEPAPSDEPAADAKDEESPAAAPADASDDADKKAPAAETEEPAKPAANAAAPTGEQVDTTPWVTENPLGMTEAVIQRGRARFEIYCAVCHGRDGKGEGLVHKRAQKILAGSWVRPSSLHELRLHEDQMPDGKIFNTITNGIRKMPGYAGQIPARDRWAIIAYLRVLQASRNVALDDIPADLRDGLSLQAQKEKQELEAAEAERKRKQEEQKKQAAESKAANSETAD